MFKGVWGLTYGKCLVSLNGSYDKEAFSSTAKSNRIFLITMKWLALLPVGMHLGRIHFKSHRYHCVFPN